MNVLGIILLVLCLLFLMVIILRSAKPTDKSKGDTDGQ